MVDRNNTVKIAAVGWLPSVLIAVCLGAILYLNPKFDDFYHGDALLHFNWSKLCTTVGCSDFLYPTNTFFFPDFLVAFITTYSFGIGDWVLVLNSVLIAMMLALIGGQFCQKAAATILVFLTSLQAFQQILGFNIGQTNAILAPYNLVLSWGHHTTSVVLGIFVASRLLLNKPTFSLSTALVVVVIIALAMSDGFTYSLILPPVLLVMFGKLIFGQSKGAKTLQEWSAKIIGNVKNVWKDSSIILLFILTVSSYFAYKFKGLYLKYDFVFPLDFSIIRLAEFVIGFAFTWPNLVLVFCTVFSLTICVQKFKNNDYDVTLTYNVGALMALVVAIAIGHQDTHRYYGILYLTPIFSASNFLASKIQDLGRLVSLLLVPVLISLSGHLFFLGNSYGSKNQRYLEFQNLDGHVASLAGSQERPILGFCPFWIGQQINYFSTTAYCIPYEKREQAIIPNRWFVKDSYWDGIRHGKIRFIIENVQPSAMSSIPKENLVILDGTTLYVKRP